jgi:hypothetical protein
LRAVVFALEESIERERGNGPEREWEMARNERRERNRMEDDGSEEKREWIHVKVANKFYTLSGNFRPTLNSQWSAIVHSRGPFLSSIL